MDATEIDPSFLLISDREMYIHRDLSLAGALGDGFVYRRIKNMLADPLLRPLLELLENGATSYEGALKLKGRGFLETRSMIARRGPFKEDEFQYVLLTDEACSYAHRWLFGRAEGPEPDLDPAESLLKAIRRYLVVDAGSGIVVGRDVLEVAIDLDDMKILGRLVHLDYGLRQLSDPGFSDPVSEADWMEARAYWSGADSADRVGAAIVSFDSSELP